MTIQHVTDLKTPIGDILQAVGPEGILIESADQTRYAVMPLDDDLVDYLIERNPNFTGSCVRIRQEMRAGKFHTHEEVKRLLADE